MGSTSIDGCQEVLLCTGGRGWGRTPKGLTSPVARRSREKAVVVSQCLGLRFVLSDHRAGAGVTVVSRGRSEPADCAYSRAGRREEGVYV